MDEWLTEYGVTLGVGALILFMIFIVWDLAKRSNAGVDAIVNEPLAGYSAARLKAYRHSQPHP